MDIALNDLFKGFLLAKEADGVRDSTLLTYKTAYRSLVGFFSAEKVENPTTLTNQDLQAWAVSLKRYATATRDQRIAKCKTFFRWCHREGFLEEDPSAVLKRPKRNWQPDPFSEDELVMILSAARQGSMGIRNYAMVCFLLDSGIRRAELCSLRPEDVQVRSGQVKVREGKGGKPRTVFIGKLAKQALWKWMVVRPEEAEYLFCSHRGRRIAPTSLTRIIHIIGERADVEPCCPHRFRHTFALKYLKLAGDPYSLQYLLGHEDMTVTRQYVKLAAMDVEDMYRSPLDDLDNHSAL